jgi:cell surface protein SprA
MYRNTQSGAQDSEKNKFLLRVSLNFCYRWDSIGAYNVQGSVVVTAGGRVLIEGIDYSVNQLGTNFRRFSSASNTPYCFFENNLFWTTNQDVYGRIKHKIQIIFMIGYYIKMSERPYTQKIKLWARISE